MIESERFPASRVSGEAGNVLGETGKIRRSRGWPVWLGVLASAFLYFAMFPPLSVAEAAYVFLIPILLVVWRNTGGPSRSREPQTKSGSSRDRSSDEEKTQPRGRGLAFFGWGWLFGFIFWISSIIWLRHVTWGGTVGLSAILALFTGLWLWFFHRAVYSSKRSDRRVVSYWFLPLVGASAWVVLEWLRSWIFWGFPWNPVSVSQWNRPAVLAMVPTTGGWGLSFLLIWINIALAQWIREPVRSWQSRGFLHMGRKIPLPLIVPLGIILVGAGWYFWHAPKKQSSPPVRVGFVQPYSSMKWDQAETNRNLRNLWEETRSLKASEPAIILWPESSTPIPVIGEFSIRQAIEALSQEMGADLLMGNMAYYPDEGIYDNGIFFVDSESGLSSEYYIKRELVPFGEFIPFREQLPFLEKFVPIGLDCRRGTEAILLPFPSADSTEGGEWVGPLVCYEDVFPDLARSSVQAGADWLFVATNNVWYGEEAGAYQHAAHAVLRAVETRRPVLRSGNAGWSGWIDEWGNIRQEIVDNGGSIYFKGAKTLDVSRDLRFDGVETPFVRLGDWFVGFCTIILVFGGMTMIRRGRTL